MPDCELSVVALKTIYVLMHTAPGQPNRRYQFRDENPLRAQRRIEEMHELLHEPPKPTGGWR